MSSAARSKRKDSAPPSARLSAGLVAPLITRYFEALDLGMLQPYGFKATFNMTFPADGKPGPWVTPYHFGIDQGPVALMIENYLTGLPWEITRRCPIITRGLRRAGFRGGWL